MAMDSLGPIVVAGTSGTPDRDFAVARYLGIDLTRTFFPASLR